MSTPAIEIEDNGKAVAALIENEGPRPVEIKSFEIVWNGRRKLVKAGPFLVRPDRPMRIPLPFVRSEIGDPQTHAYFRMLPNRRWREIGTEGLSPPVNHLP